MDLAISEGVAGPASEKLGRLLRTEELTRLNTQARLEAVRHCAYLALLRKFAASLEKANVLWAVLKGPALATLSYGDMPRGYADLDILVPPRQLRSAVQALESAGAVLAEQEWSHYIAHASGQLNMVVAGSPLVDLHWHIVNLPDARDRWMIPVEELLERRCSARLGQVEAWVLDAEDTTAHLALHAWLHTTWEGTAEQLRLLLDIERTVANRPPEWEVLVRRCRAWLVGVPVSVMLNRARQTLGAAVPEGVVKALAGGRFNRLVVRQLGVWAPSARLPGSRSVKNALTRSLREEPLSTVAQFIGETRRSVAGLAHPMAPERHQEPDVAESLSARAGFERYLEMVDRADRYGHIASRPSTKASGP